MTLEPTEFATETQLWNAIVRHFGQAFPLPSGQVVLQAATAPTGKQPLFRLGLGRGLSFTLALQDFPFARLAGVDLTLEEILALPKVLSDGLLLAAVDALRIALPPALTNQIELPSGPGAEDLPDCWIGVEMDIGGGASARGLIGGRQQDFVQLLSLLFPDAAGQGGRIPSALLADLSVEIALAVGETTLPIATIRGLEPGDVLLAAIHPDQRSFQIGNRDVRIGADTMTSSPNAPASGWSVKEIRMTDEPLETGASAPSLDDVPLTLRFVTEDQRIALSDLQGLAVGALLPLAASALVAGLPVRIQANGMTIGEGQLIQIDGSFAVRIARLAPRAS